MSTIKNTVYRGMDGKVRQTTFDMPSELGPHEVLVKITHSGLCGTDIHGIAHGIALGHEGVGIVTAVGSSVTSYKVGDRAGGGFLRNSCGNCKYCLSGREIWCLDRNIFLFADFNTGTFSDYYIGLDKFIYHIPDSIASEHAAPLQCAGATVYSALVDNLEPGDRVGIVGMGGLGHLAVQFANKLGAETVVFSTSRNKEAEARGFGASEFVLLSELEKVQKPVDVVLIAGSQYPDWSKFLLNNVVARRARIIPLNAPPSTVELPAESIFWQGYDVVSSLVSSPKTHIEMLNFAGHHGIKPVIETFDMSEAGIAQALEKMENGTIRYRGVLVNAEKPLP
ncbi:hypothetical protein V502_00266 [Pseudogymnoascus sp. VKM F-4520 (FW-2644)]|nr:hypothetical protein V502_00266 [Pseudogymnoascus sp. VKM F-4520 (FW-2644)]